MSRIETEDDTHLSCEVEPDDCGDLSLSSPIQVHVSRHKTPPDSRLHIRPEITKHSGDSDEGYKSFPSFDTKDHLERCLSRLTVHDSTSPDKYEGDGKQSSLKSIDEGYDEEHSIKTDSCPSTWIEENSNWDETENIKPTISVASETNPCGDDFPTETIFEIYIQDEDGDTKLHLAIIHKMVAIAEEFISLAPDHNWLDIPNCLLQTPLHVSVITQQHSITRRLIVGGACVTLQDTRGFTPLHIACMQNDIETVRLLLTPVKYEEQKKNVYQIPYQKIPQNMEIKNYEGHTCLHLAAQNTNLEMMKILLDKGANINCQDGKSGRTCLHYAAETNNLKLLDFLLSQAGLNINAVTYGGQSAMALAEGHKYYNVVKIIHDHGGSMMDDEVDDDSDSDPDMIVDSLISNFMNSEHFIS